MKLAIIETGGKQYRVSPGQVITTEKLSGADTKGGKITFDKVLLLVDDGDRVEIGMPYVIGAKIEGELLQEGRGKKLVVMTYKAKTRFRKKYGHRQPFAKIKIAG